MLHWRRRLRDFLYQEDGPTATEYAVMFALILLVLIASVRSLGTKVDGSFASASQGW
jgi:Flp pilus assembly pilin Flp